MWLCLGIVAMLTAGLLKIVPHVSLMSLDRQSMRKLAQSDLAIFAI